jgi:hypothetical protein
MGTKLVDESAGHDRGNDGSDAQHQRHADPHERRPPTGSKCDEDGCCDQHDWPGE